MAEGTGMYAESADSSLVAGRDGRTYRSPEQVALDVPIAGPMSRMLAFMIDYLVLVGLEILILVAALFAIFAGGDIGDDLASMVAGLVDEESGEPDFDDLPYYVMVVLMLVDFAMQWGYFVLVEQLMQGRSPGKAMMGLRVVRMGGVPLDLRGSLMRNLLRVVDMLPSYYLIGLTSMFVSPQTQRLGDIAAGTLVIREDRPAPAMPIVLGPAPAGSTEHGAESEAVETAPVAGSAAFRFDRAQLQALGRTEKRLLRQTLRRSESLDAEQADRALARAVQVLSEQIGFQEPVPPEQCRAFLVALLRDAEQAG